VKARALVDAVDHLAHFPGVQAQRRLLDLVAVIAHGHVQVGLGGQAGDREPPRGVRSSGPGLRSLVPAVPEPEPRLDEPDLRSPDRRLRSVEHPAAQRARGQHAHHQSLRDRLVSARDVERGRTVRLGAHDSLNRRPGRNAEHRAADCIGVNFGLRLRHAPRNSDQPDRESGQRPLARVVDHEHVRLAVATGRQEKAQLSELTGPEIVCLHSLLAGRIREDVIGVRRQGQPNEPVRARDRRFAETPLGRLDQSPPSRLVLPLRVAALAGHGRAGLARDKSNDQRRHVGGGLHESGGSLACPSLGRCLTSGPRRERCRRRALRRRRSNEQRFALASRRRDRALSAGSLVGDLLPRRPPRERRGGGD
jgi:hypothetical protein